MNDILSKSIPSQSVGTNEARSSSGGTMEMARPNLEAVLQLPVQVRIVLGSVTMPVSALVRLGRGAVIGLDRKVGEPVDVTVNGRLIARGEVVVLDDDNSRFGVSLTEIIEASTPPMPSRR